MKRLFLLLFILLLVGCNNEVVMEKDKLQEENRILKDSLVELENLLSNEEIKNERLKSDIEDLNDLIGNLEEEIVGLNKQVKQRQIDLFPHSFYQVEIEEYEKKVFIDHEAYIKILPYDHALEINYIFENSVVTVLDKVLHTSDEAIDNYWYYVLIDVYDTPINTKGWINASETIHYTEEIRNLVHNPLSVRVGSTIYEGWNFPDDLGDGHITTYEEVGFKEGEEDGFVRLGTAGGRSIWTKKENILYPQVE